MLVNGVNRQGVPVAGLERALAAYDLDGAETPDLLATCESPAVLAQHADAILTQRTPPLVFSGAAAARPGGPRGGPTRAGGGMTPTRVSCICTAYDVGPYIGAAIDSALAQDYAGELEIVAVDDGSTDETGAILDSYGDRITVVHQPNGRFVSAVNAGLAAATGDYLALLDGDDEWPAHKVRRQAEFLDDNPAVGLVFGDMEVIDGDGARHESFWRFEGIHVARGDVFERLTVANFASGGASMFRAAYRDRFDPIPDGPPGRTGGSWSGSARSPSSTGSTSRSTGTGSTERTWASRPRG